MPQNLLKPIKIPNYWQALIAFVGLSVGLAIFIGMEHLVTPGYKLSTSLDADIPFLPWSWIFYVLFFPFTVMLAAYASEVRFKRFLLAAVVAFAVALLFFYLFPESLVRPDAGLIENAFLHQRFSRMWMVDLPANGFPSLHVAITCLACSMFKARPYRSIVTVIGLLICLSTLTVKQHTLADVVGGLLLAGLSAWLAARWRKEEVTPGQG